MDLVAEYLRIVDWAVTIFSILLYVFAAVLMIELFKEE